MIKTVQVFRQLRCEVCGRKINGKLIACNECAKLGKTYHEEPRLKIPSSRSKAGPTPLRASVKKPQVHQVDTSHELVENFDVKIRQAREKFRLSHEELGKKINEKVSLLRKIETGKMSPDNRLATILEHALKIKLIVLAKEEKITQAKAAKIEPRELTLGDLIQLGKKGKEKEGTTGRRPS
jgi:putative transcription factor